VFHFSEALENFFFVACSSLTGHSKSKLFSAMPKTGRRSIATQQRENSKQGIISIKAALELDADPTYVDHNSHNSGPCNDVFEYKCYLTSLSLPLYSIQTPISAPLTSLELMARSCITPYPRLGRWSTAKHRCTNLYQSRY
jgi:hypothetical protein